MSGSKESHSANVRLAECLARPRFLRVIPSLVVLTTALAWSASIRGESLGFDDGVRAVAEISVATGEIDRSD